MSTGFDRLRPREPRPEGAPTVGRDPMGKRALFSSNAPEEARPGAGSVSVTCSGCAERTVLSPVSALRAALPSVVLGFEIAYRDRTRSVGWTGDRGAWLRCPACRNLRWVTLTITI